MRATIDEVEIKDPPLEELTGRGNCLRKSCGTCSGLFLTLLIGSFLTLYFTAPPQGKVLKAIPAEYTSVPLYDAENIETITLTAARERAQRVEQIAFVPKLILSPILIQADRNHWILHQIRPQAAEAIEGKDSFWDKLMVLLREPVSEQRDLLTLVWHNLDADPAYISEYYSKSLERAGFRLGLPVTSPGSRQFTFTKPNLDGVVYVVNDPQTPATDQITLEITRISTSTTR